MPAYTPKQIEEAISQLKEGWGIIDDKCIDKPFHFKTFVDALVFVNNVGMLAEAVQHHPDMSIQYNKVVISLSTHDAGGVTQKDVDMAKKIEGLL